MTILAAIFFMAAYIYYAYNLPNIQDYLDSKSKKVIQVNYSNGKQIKIYSDSDRSKAEFYELPTHLINAVLAVEDQNFFNHKGFDIKGIMRAFTVNQKSGKIIQGGSTITQQLAKILFLGPEKKMKRKIKELILAFRLESALTKEKILTLYLNNAYFGSGNYGVKSAAKYYFKKSVSDIALKESTMLAALLKAPSMLSNIANKDKADERADLVLEKMIKSGFIDASSYQESISNPGSYKKKRLQKLYFADYVYKNYKNYITIGDDSSKITIDTTLNERLQNIVENELSNFVSKIDKSEISIIVMDKYGSIQAMSGGKDYQKNQFNRAVDSKKEIRGLYDTFVYLYAFENGYSPDDKISNNDLWSDEQLTVKYQPISLISAFSDSADDFTSVRLSKELGVENIMQYAEKAGLDTKNLTSGTEFEDNLVNVSASYAVIINDGYPIVATSITGIQDSNFNNLYKKKFIELPKLISNRSLNYIVKLLKNTVSNGSAREAKSENSDVFGKDYTSKDGRNSWFIGSDGNLIVGIWVGDDEIQTDKTSKSLPAALFSKIISKINQPD